MTIGIKTRFAAHNLGGGGLVLSNAVGSVIALLDALLVNGWNLRTAQTLVVAADGQSAQLSYAADHGYALSQVLRLSGSPDAWANVDCRILSIPTPRSVVVSLTGPGGVTASGIINSKCAPAGWTKTHANAATYEAVYRPADPEAPYLYVKNDVGGSTWWSEARGYLTMPALGSGTGPFPNLTQKATSPWSVCVYGDAGWWFAGDDRTFYLGTPDNDRARHACGFGAFDEFEPVPRSVSSGWLFITPNGATSRTAAYANTNSFAVGVSGMIYAPYDADDLVASTLVQVLPLHVRTGTSVVGGRNTGYTAPHPRSGGIMLAPVHLQVVGDAGRTYYLGAARGWLDPLHTSVTEGVHQNVPGFGEVVAFRGDLSSTSKTGAYAFSLADWY
ncbi:hypothetical protein [Chitinimonas taiwanensis]|uniref:hypothetical protein n=1 Tax=Chitinimonas taiwanensis TaxID=240412 RepID=UPI0035B12698